MRSIALVITLILGITVNAQIKFEPGYFINNSGKKINCFIKNVDWKNNPKSFLYTTIQDGDPVQAYMSTVQEFGINETLRYKRVKVKIDRSSSNINHLSDKRDPVFKEERVFLKVLVASDASLYQYEEEGLIRYFFSVDNGLIEPLIYKKYFAKYIEGKGSTKRIAKNETYKQQLIMTLKCDAINRKRIENLSYNRSALTRLFLRYNNCKNATIKEHDLDRKRDLFNLTIKGGVRRVSLVTIDGNSFSKGGDFESKMNPFVEIEAEVILPFNKDKWSLFIAPSYQYYKASGQVRTPFTATVKYTSVEVPVGIRHYFFLNDNSRIFVNGAFVFDFNGKDKVIYTRSANLDIDTIGNLAFGLGYNYKGKYSVELRYGLNRNLFTNYVSWNSEFKPLSLLIGYTIF